MPSRKHATPATDDRQEPLPIQPVDKPILCTPYAEPDQHWVYDPTTGIPTRTPGRREASYWYKTERTGSAQQQLVFMAEENRDNLPLVNALREDVRRWRQSQWKGASETTKTLLRHWWREDRPRRLFFCQLEAAETVIYLREMLAQGRVPQFKPQLSLADHAALMAGENPRPQEWVAKVAQHPRLADRPHGDGHQALVRYACKMATGSGKTVVMALLLAWAFCNRNGPTGDARFPRRALVVCPNLTIKERLSVLRPGDPDNYFDKFDLVPSGLRPALAGGRVLVANWHLFNPQAEEIRVGGVAIGQLGPETPEAFARARLGELGVDEPLLVLNDEGHHAYRPAPVREGEALTAEERAEREEATVWVSGLDRINAACGVAFSVDLSATPFYLHGSGYPEGSPFPWIVSDFGLVDAIESGITKIPRLPAVDNTGRPEPQFFKLWQHVTANLASGERLPGGKPKPEVVFRKAEAALLTLAGQWAGRLKQIEEAAPGQDRTPPVLIVVCDNTDIAEHFHRMISGEETIIADGNADDDTDDGDEDAAARRRKKARPVKRYGNGLAGFPQLWNRPGREVTLRVDSNLLAAAESEDPNATRKEAAEELRRIVSSVGRIGAPGEHIRCVVSVNMLSEGWDANNVTHILGLRAFHSQLLCEQVVGRGLRRMDYTPDPATGRLTEEYVDVFGVPFSLIPFKGRPPGDPPPPDDRPKHEVLALPERAAFEIRFPVVEGFVVDLKRNLLRCDIEAMTAIRLDPVDVPTAAFVRPQVGYAVGTPGQATGFGFELVTREVYYRETHPQTIAFEIAREVVRRLTDASQPNSERLRAAGRAALFPQVLQFAQRYIRERVDLNGCHPCEVGLQVYAQRIVGLLMDAIRPDEDRGEPPLLPRLNRYRPTGSSAAVRFKTVKPVQATSASHLNFVAADTGSWEQAAATQLEMAAKQGLVQCYVRNDRLELNIPYEFYGQPRTYEPDFVVRMADGSHLLLEVKGPVPAEVSAKHEAAARWVAAVNRWGQLGRWRFLPSHEPQRLVEQLGRLTG
jgi:type III restriction enzyme